MHLRLTSGLMYHFCHNNDQFCQRPCFRKNLWYIDIEISISVSTISKPGRISMKFSPLELLLVISIAVIVGIVLVVLVKYLIRYAIKFLRKNWKDTDCQWRKHTMASLHLQSWACLTICIIGTWEVLWVF